MYTLSYKLIKQRLKGINGVKSVDWYTNQYRPNDKNGQLRNTPAIFVEYLPSDTIKYGNIQRSTIDVKIHLVTNTFYTNDKRIQNDTESDHLYLFEAIYKALHAKRGKLSEILGNEDLANNADLLLFNALARVNINPPHGQDKQMSSVQTFRAIFYDHSAIKQYTKITATPVIDS